MLYYAAAPIKLYWLIHFNYKVWKWEEAKAIGKEWREVKTEEKANNIMKRKFKESIDFRNKKQQFQKKK